MSEKEQQKQEAAKAEAEQQKQEAPRAPYEVAAGKSVTTRRGIKGPGDAVGAGDFAGDGVKVLNDLVARKVVVRNK